MGADSEDLYRAFFFESLTAGLICNKKNIITQVNEAFSILSGYPEGLVNQKPVESFIAEKQQPEFNEYIEKKLKNDKHSSIAEKARFALVGRSGSEIPVAVKIIKNKNSEEFIISFDAIARRNRLKSRSVAAETRLKAILNHNSSALYLKVHPSQEVIVNNTFVSLFGYSHEQMQTISLESLTIEEDADKEADYLQRFNEDKISSYTIEKRMKNKTSEILNIQETRFKVETGIQEWYTLVIIDDTSSQRISERALLESEQQFRDFFEKNTAAILLAEDEERMNILDANEAAAKFYEISVPYLKKMDLRELCPTLAKQRWEDLRKSEKSYIVIDQHVTGSGEIRDVEVHITPLVIKNRKAILMILNNITDRILYEKKLNEKTRQLHEFNRMLETRVEKEVEKRQHRERMLFEQHKQAAMGDLLNSIAHHWRQPLTTIGLILQDLPEAWDFNQVTREYLEVASQRAMRHLNELSRTISNFTGLAGIEDQEAEFRLIEALNDMILLISPQYEAKGIKLNLFLPEEQDVTVYGNESEFKHAITNILNNCSHAAENKMHDNYDYNAEITITARVGEALFELIIEDNGGELPVDELDRIFEPYSPVYRAEGADELGLFLSRRAIELNFNGHMGLEPVEDGVRFLLHLPVEQKNIITIDA